MINSIRSIIDITKQIDSQLSDRKKYYTERINTRSHHLILSKLSVHVLIKSGTVLVTGLTVGDCRDIPVLRNWNKSTDHERPPSLGDFLLCRNSVVRPVKVVWNTSML